ncbi:MAG: TlpA family protein disulfide reductase [Clostridiales bacterium]|nr:TlpA family protein disulfide reductase [Clostridiales bacterium]
MTKKPVFILTLALILVLVGCAKAPTTQPPAAERPDGSEDLPGFVFAAKDAFGNEVSQNDWAEYDLIMLNFWATWCPPCLAELPDLQELWQEYGPQGLLILGVLADGVAADALPYIEQHGLTYPVFAATGDLKLRNRTMQYVPTTLFVTPDGQELKEVVGANSFDGWSKIIEELLP